MKKFFVAIAALLFAGISIVSAQTTLTIHQKDGEKFSFGFSEKPVVSFTDNDLIVKTSTNQVTCALTAVAKFTFDSGETTVGEVKSDAEPAISLDEYAVMITNAKADDKVLLTGADGKLLQSYKVAEDGSVSFSISELPAGTYIISTSKLSIKILKK